MTTEPHSLTASSSASPTMTAAPATPLSIGLTTDTAADVPADVSADVIGKRTDLTSLLTQVPNDPWFRVRVLAMISVAATYLCWLRFEGLIIDRISAVIALGVFLIAAFVGKPWFRWAQVAAGAAAYVGMWFVYENTRGAADRLGMPYQMATFRNADRALFFGAQPNEWLQQHWYAPGEVGLHDQILSLIYYSHFVVPVVVLAAVWAAGHVRWARYMKRFASVVLVACIVFVLLPTVPPWMASDARFGWGVGEPLVRNVRAGILDLGFTGFAHDWGVGLDWSNPVAAMPSLHAAFSMFVAVYVRPMLRWRWLRAVVFAYPATMAVALVYFAEHWVIDIFAGWTLTAASFALWARIERRQRTDHVVLAARAGVGRADAIPSASTTRNPSVVLLTAPLLRAIVDDTSVDHERAIAHYTTLLRRYHADEIRLVARHDHLDLLHRAARHTVLAPVAEVRVVEQYRRQAARLSIDGRATDELVSLVVGRRERAVAVIDLDATGDRTTPTSDGVAAPPDAG